MSKLAVMILFAVFIGSTLHLGSRHGTESQADGRVVEVVNPDVTATDQFVAMVTVVSALILYATVPFFRLIANVVIGVLIAELVIKKLTED